MPGSGFQVAPGATAIGRYFTVVSAIPSAVLASYLLLLVKSGAWTGDVRLADAIGDLGLKDAAALGVTSLLLALVLHPLQYALIQFFEGYWGNSRLAVRLGVLLTARHLQRARNLRTSSRAATNTLESIPDAPPETLRLRVREREGRRLFNAYPEDLRQVMPTRLGNTLKHYERAAGAMYEIDAATLAPRVAMVAQARELEYLDNQRVQLELAIRTAFLGAVAAVVTVAFMWQHGFWILLALAPYAVGYVSYRGAVVVAHEYGTALGVVLELNRFALYERLHLPLPEDIEEERELNQRLLNVLRMDNLEVEFRRGTPLDYSHERPGKTSAGTPIPPVRAKAEGGPASDDPEDEEA